MIALSDGTGGFLLVTRDPMADTVNPPDGRLDAGLLRLGADLAPGPDDPAAGTADACGALLLGGAGDQRPVTGFPTGAGAFLVAAEETPPDPADPERVFAFAFDASGEALFREGVVRAGAADRSATSLLAAPDGLGGFFLGWQENSDTEGLTGTVFAQRFDAAGAPVWAPAARLSAEGRATATGGRLLADGAGGAFVAWSEWRDQGAMVPLLQHLDADGVPSWDAARPVDGARPGAPVVLVPGSAGPVALFLADVPRAQAFGADGAPLWGAAGVPLAPPPGGTMRSDLHALAVPGGGAWVTWIESAAGGQRLVARRLGDDGTVLWPGPVVLIDRPAGIPWRTEAVSTDGSIVVAAVVTPSGFAAETDLVVQAIDRRGRLRAAAEGAALCSAPGSQTVPIALAPTARGGAAFAWSDTRPGTGVEGADAIVVQEVAIFSSPRLDTAGPLLVRQGDERVFDLVGDDLQPGLTIDAGPGIAAWAIDVVPIDPEGPGDRLHLRLRAAGDAALGSRALVLRNPDGGAARSVVQVVVSLDPWRADMDGSGRVDGGDLALLAASFGIGRGADRFIAAADIDGSGLVDGVDLALLAARFGARSAAARAVAAQQPGWQGPRRAGGPVRGRAPPGRSRPRRVSSRAPPAPASAAPR